MKIGQRVEFTYQSASREQDFTGTVVSQDAETVCVAVESYDDLMGGYKTELKFVPRSILEPQETSPIIDAVAQAICESAEADIWRDLDDACITKAMYRQQARDAIEAYEKARG